MLYSLYRVAFLKHNYHFKCKQFLVEIYLSRVSLVSVLCCLILIIPCAFATDASTVGNAVYIRGCPTSALLGYSLGEWARCC